MDHAYTGSDMFPNYDGSNVSKGNEWFVRADLYADIEYNQSIKEIIRISGRWPDGEEMLHSPEAWIDEVMKEIRQDD